MVISLIVYISDDRIILLYNHHFLRDSQATGWTCDLMRGEPWKFLWKISKKHREHMEQWGKHRPLDG